MGLLNMVGGNVPPIPIDTGGGGGREYTYNENEENETRRRKMIKMHDEQILEIIKIWVQNND